MEGPISVVLSDIYFYKMGQDIVAPSKPLSYKHYVDDTYVRGRRMKLADLPSPKYKTDLRTESKQVPRYKDYSK